MDEQTLQTLKDILDYVESTGNYSYYDLKAYVYKEKTEWIPLLEKKTTRSLIAEYLRSGKKDSGKPYKTSMAKAARSAVEAAAEYGKKKYKEEIARYED